MAKFIPIGKPAHDAEKNALHFLAEGLPDDFTVYGNPWLVERSGVIYELDAVVVAPRAIFVVEIKAHRGRIEGTDNDWWLPEKIRSPLKLNRLTAQVLKSHLRNASYQAGQVWVEGFVFLSGTTDVGVRGPASTDRVHTRRTILTALQDDKLIERISNGRAGTHGTPTDAAAAELSAMFIGTQEGNGPRPVRSVREYDVIDTLELHDTYSEQLGRNRLTLQEKVLRTYHVPPLATEAQRKRIEDRARWESQVLGRLGKCEGIIGADLPFLDNEKDGNIVLPLEYFKGISLPTWIERYGPTARGKDKASFPVRIGIWQRLANAIEQAHRHGVVHRLLRPDVVLLEDAPDPQQVRITGFDLAKQLSADSTIALTTVADERLINAAPEVVSAFSSAEPASDQFSLGALLALLITGKPLFESTRQFVAAGRILTRVSAIAAGVPHGVEAAIERMVKLRAAERFSNLSEAIDTVKRALNKTEPTLPNVSLDRAAPLDVENLQNGQRIGTDYQIAGRLGQGGMSVVYAAKHLVSGHTRALKIATTERSAEDALRGEYEVLSTLDHANIVKVIDLSKMIEGHLTLVMERVGNENLRQWLAKQALRDTPVEPAVLRRLAEDLLSGLEYLEQRGVTHKDLKPDNLLVHHGGLFIIDFSLATMASDAPYGGTALYRDPASITWTHATDRFAAALCLFELYAGRHAFDGRVPEPGQEPLVREDDIQPAKLAEFFRRALAPDAARRFPSTRSMRDEFVRCLGEERSRTPTAPPSPQLDVRTPLALAGLSGRGLNALARCQVTTVGDVLALTPVQIRAIHSIGSKTASDIITFRQALLDRGLTADTATIAGGQPAHALVPELCDALDPTSKLSLTEAIHTALAQAQLTTIGAVAALSQRELLALPGIGPRKLADVVEELYRFANRRNNAPGSDAATGPRTLDRIWDAASATLSHNQRECIELSVGLRLTDAEPITQQAIAERFDKSQAQVSLDINSGVARLEHVALADVSVALDDVLDSLGGIERIGELGQLLEQRWPAGEISGIGMVRLLARVSAGKVLLHAVDGVAGPLLTQPVFDTKTLAAFVAEVFRLAQQWPMREAEAARATLTTMLPAFTRDPLALAARIADHVKTTKSGQLFVPPIDAPLSFAHVLNLCRTSITLDDLCAAVRAEFGDDTPIPAPDELLQLLGSRDYQVRDNMVLPNSAQSIVAYGPPATGAPTDTVEGGAAALSANPSGHRHPAELVRDQLLHARYHSNFRMLIVPPEQQHEIGQSVARALGCTAHSFDDAFFSGHHGDLASLERAERFKAQRVALNEAADATLVTLLETHGRPGGVNVLLDTGLWGLCDALDFPRRLYDETSSGSLGFWVLIVPGTIVKRQPHFNEATPMWHLDGITLALTTALPPPLQPSSPSPLVSL